MDIDAVYPTKYLKAADLQGRNVTVTIERVETEEIGFGRDKESKAVVYFHKSKRGLVLNITNKNAIKAAYGKETNDWIGKQLVMFPAMVDFAGDTVESIRVRAPSPQQTTKRSIARAKEEFGDEAAKEKHDERNPPPFDDDMNDEVPF